MGLGFWSYLREDDQGERGRISELANDVVEQYKMITGEQIEVFLDKKDIEWGDKWRQKIDDNLKLVEFFIPVITPRYFNSPSCRHELSQFLRNARRLGRLELLLPLYYVDVPLLTSDEPTEDDLIQSIRDAQWEDWRDLRFESLTSKEYRRQVYAMATRLAKVNEQLEKINIDETVPGSETDDENGYDAPGTIDRLARYEEVMVGGEFRETLTKIASHIVKIGEVMREATSTIKKTGGRNPFARRIQVIRMTAMRLANPADETLGAY